MPRNTKSAQSLTTLEIDAAQPRDKPYRLNDGGSLYVIVRPSGVKSWEFRYKRAGDVQPLVLGVYGNGRGDMGAKAARTERDRLKGLIADGKDPAAEREINAEGQQATLAAARAAKAARKTALATAKTEAAK